VLQRVTHIVTSPVFLKNKNEQIEKKKKMKKKLSDTDKTDKKKKYNVYGLYMMSSSVSAKFLT